MWMRLWSGLGTCSGTVCGLLGKGALLLQVKHPDSRIRLLSSLDAFPCKPALVLDFNWAFIIATYSRHHASMFSDGGEVHVLENMMEWHWRLMLCHILGNWGWGPACRVRVIGCKTSTRRLLYRVVYSTHAICSVVELKSQKRGFFASVFLQSLAQFQ